jgi:chromosome segregation ATPase
VRCSWASARVFLKAVWKTPDGMAKRPSTPGDLRDAVERTVQATLGSAERQRERTQGALDDLAGTVDQLRRGAEAGIARGRRAIEERRPATSEDIRELKAELRRIGRRLDQIEERLPKKRSGGAKRSASSGGAKRSASSGAKRSSAGGANRPASGERRSS